MSYLLDQSNVERRSPLVQTQREDDALDKEQPQDIHRQPVVCVIVHEFF